VAFQISALDPAAFASLFSMADAELADHLAVRMSADKQPGFPCRVSLVDAEPGDEVILVNYRHQQCPSPYQASHAVFVRAGAEQARPAVDEVPHLFRSRMLSLRAFNDAGMIVGGELIDGTELGAGIDTLLRNPAAAYLHIHYAKFGCYAARADRA
jgi:hypothetical protein